jgi:hypothetical protein
MFFATLMSNGRGLAQTQTVVGLLVCVRGSIVLPRSPLSCAKVPCALALSGCPSQAASGRLSSAKVPCAFALWAVCPLAVSVWLFATAVAVAKASRHRGCATVTWCVWRDSCASSDANEACGLGRGLRLAFAFPGPLHEHEFMQT